MDSSSYALSLLNRRPNLISIDSDYARPVDSGSSYQPLSNFASRLENKRLVDPHHRSISNNIGGLLESVESRYEKRQQQPSYDPSSRPNKSNRGDTSNINQTRPRRVRFDVPITTRPEHADIRDKNKPNRTTNNWILKENVSNSIVPKINRRYNKAGSIDSYDTLSLGLSSSFSVNPPSRKWRDLSQYRK